MAVLKASRRDEMGSHKARALRAQGLIPGVIYGHGEDVQTVSLNEHEVDMAIHHGERLLEVELEGKIQNVLIKDVQWDTFGKEPLHLDLTRVNLDERVTVTVPIVLRGTPAGANDGGVLQQSLAEIDIECTVRSIPEDLHVMVTEMQIGDSLKASDLELPEGTTIMGDADVRVCSVTIIEEEAEEGAEEGTEEGTQPEIVGEKKDEDGEDQPAE